MFTGIIQAIGTVSQITKDKLIIETPDLTSELKKGSSIAVDGACLTVVDLSDTSFTADFMPETAAKTTIGLRNTGDTVNLELAMAVSDRFEGHIVSGHVEGLAEIIEIREDENAKLLIVQIPDELTKYTVPKGSITINGISLTIIAVDGQNVQVGIIPHTWDITNLKTLSAGDRVNIETDILAKYVEKML